MGSPNFAIGFNARFCSEKRPAGGSTGAPLLYLHKNTSGFILSCMPFHTIVVGIWGNSFDLLNVIWVRTTQRIGFEKKWKLPTKK
mmetsp:Transcript_77484/g.155297  ORF Transcript_77484/g.155297 Transcript_77484/m.155297 type:complete len:85 (-) Transcript_77484:83-337(-)